MENFAKRGSDVFCPGQTFISGSENHVLLPNESNHSGVRGAHHLIAKIREFEYLEDINPVVWRMRFKLKNDEMWPTLPVASWKETYETLHMLTQIVGKIRLATTPMENHWWNSTLYVTPTGLTTIGDVP